MDAPERSRVVKCLGRSLTFFFLLVAPGAAAGGLGEGSELEIGGPGEGQGKFSVLTDMAFDGAGNLHVLDGGKYDTKAGQPAGNFLIQKFDNSGKFLGQFSIRDEKLGEKNEPTRLAVDSKGNVYVTQPAAGLVQQYAPDGKLLNSLEVPGAYAIAIQKAKGGERVVVAARPGKRRDEAIQQLEVIGPSGKLGEPVKLSRQITAPVDMAADGEGNLYVLADINQIYKFDPAGALLAVIGGGTKLRLEDGSELLHTVALDSKGNLYSMTWGNPAKVTRFDPKITTATQREGQFKWADPWSTHSSYVICAIDGNDRLWVGVPGSSDGKERYHFKPCVLRTRADYLDAATKQVTVRNTMTLGLNLAVEPNLPYGIAYELAPVSIDFVVKPGVRRVQELSVEYHVWDVYKTEAGKGRFDLKLKDGEESRRTITFTPPRWGWYTAELQVSSQGRRLIGVGGHVGVTPKFPGMAVLEPNQSPGGWEDAPRQAFAGLMLMRIHPSKGNIDKLDKVIDDAAKYGLTVLAQFTGEEQCTADFVRQVVTRYKGRVKYWEIFNEPNLRMPADKYVPMCKELYGIIKQIDPDAKVASPALCGVNLQWHKQFYDLGGKGCCDILSIHDYEGHESVDPFHWRWKIGELRKIMAGAGDADKPIWQTERAIPAVRCNTFMGGAQAVRATLHRDILSSLGIPSEHNSHYYLNQSGYGSVPSYLWSAAGPHPGALATRTREAMILGRRFVGALDFGPTGNRIFLGLRYQGQDGATIILRNLGTLDTPLELGVTGGESLEVVDAFGNSRQVPVRDGKATVTTQAMPVYLRLAKGQELPVPKIDFGQNIAPLATFAYSDKVKDDNLAALNNGILESTHFGDPCQYKYFQGEANSFPQTLEIAFPGPQTVSRMLIFSLRADNVQTAVLDYDVQYHDGAKWVTVQEVRTPLPPSDLVETPQCHANTWYMDQNFFVNEFKPVTAGKFRLVFRKTTLGTLADEIAEKAWGGKMGCRIHLREVEIYGPPK